MSSTAPDPVDVKPSLLTQQPDKVTLTTCRSTVSTPGSDLPEEAEVRTAAQEPPRKRFKVVTAETVTALADAVSSKSTKAQTRWAVKCFKGN